MNGLRDEIRCGSLHLRWTSRHHSRWPGRPRNAYCVARSRATGSIADNLPTAKADATDTSAIGPQRHGTTAQGWRLSGPEAEAPVISPGIWIHAL